MAFRSSQKDDERKLSSSFKGRFGSLDDPTSTTLTPERSRRKSRVSRNEPFSPYLRPKSSHVDLIFDMDEEDSPELSSALGKQTDAEKPTTHGGELPQDAPSAAANLEGFDLPPLDPMETRPLRPAAATTPAKSSAEVGAARAGNPWGSSPLPTSKLDLREIMTEATSSNSVLSAGLAAQKGKDVAPKLLPNKLSQKERKRQQQQLTTAQATQDVANPQSSTPWETPKGGTARLTAWSLPRGSSPANLNDALAAETGPTILPNTKPSVVAESSAKSIRRTASPDTRFAGQPRTSRPPLQKPPASAPLVPHSKVYIRPAAKAEASLGSSMADIIGQQQREQQIVKEAVAKRSLQEIQQEQEFQQWWDQESRRTQEEEARRSARGKGKEESRGRGRRGRGGKSSGGASGAAGGDGGRGSGGGSGRAGNQGRG